MKDKYTDLKEEVRQWANDVFTGKIQFDPETEARFKARLFAALEEIKGLANMEEHANYFTFLLNNWHSPKLSASPGPRVKLSEETSNQIKESLKMMSYNAEVVKTIESLSEDDAMMFAYHHFHSLRMDAVENPAKYRECDQLISSLKPEKLSNVVILSVLTITKAIENKVPQRKHFFQKAKEVIIERSGEKSAKDMLRGLE